MTRLLSVLVTFWAGSLWTICGVVAPSLFAVLGDRHEAGKVAAQLFKAEAFIGVIVAALLLAMTSFSPTTLSTWRGRIIVGVTALLPLISLVAVTPMMDKAQAVGDMARFGMLHGVSAVLFVLACVSALLLVWEFNRRAE